MLKQNTARRCLVDERQPAPPNTRLLSWGLEAETTRRRLMRLLSSMASLL